MSLAEDLGPYVAIELTASQIDEYLGLIVRNLPSPEDLPKEKLLKFSTIEKCLIIIKEATKEMMAARVMGTIQAVDENEAGSRQASLTELDKGKEDTQITIAVNGGEAVNLTLDDMARAQDKLKGELDRRAGQE
jgi:hypothetical protein